ncbi:hypothetical protein OSTOST_10051 [Ostertagia ostertagi]
MKGDGNFQSMTSFRFSETYLQHIMSGPIVDLLIRNDKSAALEALRNLWSYRLLETLHLESCDLSDQDLESIRPGSTCVKYVCLRNNQLVHPWSTLAKNFLALNYLDCRENRWLTMDLSAMKGLQLAPHGALVFEYASPVVALARQLAELNAEQVANSERKAVEEALVVELGRLEAEHREEVEEAADEVREEHVVALPFNSRISTPHPTFQQSVIYAAVFKLHFGVSEKMAGFLDDFLAMKGF